MLRCTVAGLIPLMNSRQYAATADTLFRDNLAGFEAIIRHKSYYLLRTLPVKTARTLLAPVMPGITAKQMKNGLWRGKNGVQTTFDIISAFDHAGLMDTSTVPHSPLAAVRDEYDEYALLIKRLLQAEFTQEDSRALAALMREIVSTQQANGSFVDTVTGTVIHMNRLLDLGMPQDDPVIMRGADYLLAQRKPSLQGIHTSGTYPLIVSDVFTTEDRTTEFQAALTYRPEWLPSHVCFRTMAIIPNAVCLILLLRLGLESAPGVSAALSSLYDLYVRHGGLCATNIKKPYL